MDEEQARCWLSPPRYERFLSACDGEHDRAIALHEWHEELSMASFGLIHRFELLVRNAVDAVLGSGQPEMSIGETWLLDFEVLRPDGVKQVITALERLEKGKVVTRGRIVAGLPYSFWAGLFGRRYEQLWRRRLRFAFPSGNVTRKEVSARMRRIQRLRNRIAHHDSLLDQDVAGRFRDMLEIAAWVDPAARAWLTDGSDALAILDAGPGSHGRPESGEAAAPPIVG